MPRAVRDGKCASEGGERCANLARGRGRDRPPTEWSSYTASVQAGTLQLTGDAASGELALDATPPRSSWTVGEDGTADFGFDRSRFSAGHVSAGRGDDRVDVIDGGATLDDLTVDGGAGDDFLRGGGGDDVLIGGAGDDSVDGNRGADTALLGSGADTFRWDPGDGSDAVEGEGGKDTLAFDGSNAGERIDLTANGSRVRLTRDVAAIDMDLGGIESLDLRALGGADTITVNDLTGTDLKAADIDLGVTGGGGDGAADTVVGQRDRRAGQGARDPVRDAGADDRPAGRSDDRRQRVRQRQAACEHARRRGRRARRAGCEHADQSARRSRKRRVEEGPEGAPPERRRPPSRC
jgi:hypothetical protein